MAKAEYEGGRILYQDGDFASALVKFEQALALSKDERLLWNIAVCEKNLRRYSKVLTTLSAYLKLGPELITDKDRSDAAELEEAVKGFVSRVTVQVNEPGADVFLDEVRVGTSPLQAPIMVDVGERRFRVTKTGFLPFEKTQSIAGANDVTIPIELAVEIHDAGWKRRDAATIELPQGLCDKLAGGTIVGVAFAPTSSACPQKDQTLPTCGPWSNAGDTPDPPGVTEPVALSTGRDHPAGLALSGGNLFWTNRGVFGEANATLRGVSVEGGSPTTVLEGLAGSRDLVALDGNLFFTNGGTGATDGSVLSVVPGAVAANLCLDGTVPFALDVPEGIAVRGNDVVFTAFGEGALYRASADGSPLDGAATYHRLPIMGLQNYPYRVGLDATRVYWTNEGTASADPPDGAVMMVAINDVGPSSSEATAIVLVGQEVTPRALLVETVEGGKSAIYFTTFAKLGGVKRVDPTAPEQVITIAADQAYPNGLAVDATYVYWTNRGDGAVKRMPKGGASGEPPTVIATGQVAPGPIVVDETHVYWANEGTSDKANGSIMKIQKP